MQLRKLLHDDEAVSPVIGVILMVAITVILAAVIASFVLGLGDTDDVAPSTTFEYDVTNDNLEISVSSGESINADRLEVDYDDGSFAVRDKWHEFSDNADADSRVSAGDSIAVGSDEGDASHDHDVLDSWEVQIIWQSEGGDSSSVISEQSGPDA